MKPTAIVLFMTAGAAALIGVRLPATSLAPVVVGAPPPKPPPPEVPPFDPTAPTSADAADEVTAALEDLARGVGDSTVDTFARAVTDAPGSARARYGLACALSITGDSAAADVQLAQLSDADALANLATDLGCRWTDLQHAGAPAPSPQRRAALAIIDALDHHDPQLAAPYFTGRRVTYVAACDSCDGSAGDLTRTQTGARTLADLFARDVQSDRRIWCTDSCCTQEQGWLSDLGIYLTSICFTRDLQVASISVLTG